jgi:hypothetical protein
MKEISLLRRLGISPLPLPPSWYALPLRLILAHGENGVPRAITRNSDSSPVTPRVKRAQMERTGEAITASGPFVSGQRHPQNRPNSVRHRCRGATEDRLAGGREPRTSAVEEGCQHAD